MRPSRLAWLASVPFLTALAAHDARASAVRVNPVSVTLSSTTSSALLTVENPSPQPLRFQVSAFAWTQKPNGEMELTPTNDIIFYPSLLKLAPGEARKLRIGSNAAPGNVEKTYRVFVEELPSLVSTNEAAAVNVTTRLGIPVFVAPQGAAPGLKVEGLAVAGKQLKFNVHNTGTAHFIEQKYRVIARDAAGKSVWTHEQSGWYVLPGGQRVREVPLPAEACSAKSLVVEIDSVEGPRASATLPDPHC